jgi:cobalt-zinc-cadmium efflux system outer membrane protein
VKYKQQSLAYQKALAVPDVTLGPNFDKNSNYTPNYVGLGISLPLPVFDRNQGNIKAARWQLKAEEANMQLADVELSNNVVSAYNKLKNTLQLNANIPSGFYEDYGTLFNKVVQSYRDRQISMVEFIDYFDTYKDAMQKQTQQLLNVQLAKDELNTQIGTDIVQ